MHLHQVFHDFNVVAEFKARVLAGAIRDEAVFHDFNVVAELKVHAPTP